MAGWIAAGVVLHLPIAFAATLGFEWVTGDSVVVGTAPPAGALRAVSILVLAPWFEEALYRGHLFDALARSSNEPTGALVAAACFALPHVDALHVIASFLAGLVLGGVRSCTHRVGPCIALHMGLNLAAAAPSALAPCWR